VYITVALEKSVRQYCIIGGFIDRWLQYKCVWLEEALHRPIVYDIKVCSNRFTSMLYTDWSCCGKIICCSKR